MAEVLVVFQHAEDQGLGAKIGEAPFAYALELLRLNIVKRY